MAAETKINFEILRYANCWEDAAILLEGLNPVPGSTIISIASAGDNCFSLLTTQPRKLIAADVNKTQLYLVELKMAGFKKLDYKGLLSFLGCTQADNRLEVYQNQLRTELSAGAMEYWDGEKEAMARGIIFAGKFEKYLNFFARKLLPFIHTKDRIDELLKIKNAAAQKEYYDKTWNNLRWKILFKIFFSRFVMGRFGRSPQMMKEVKLPVNEFIYNKAALHLSGIYCQQNPYLEYILTGSFVTRLPHYLQPENFDIIKQNLDKIELRLGSVEHAADEPCDYMNLSNIFEYMNPQKFTDIGHDLEKITVKGASVAYWNLMVPRHLSSLANSGFQYDEKLSDTLHPYDRCFFYNSFIIDRKS